AGSRARPAPASSLPSSRPRPRRRLRSFPTRRSSDLSLSLPERRTHKADGLQSVVDLHHRTPSSSPKQLLYQRRLLGDTAPDTFEDRKSTRLNSSHRTISYAVFCLKKKTQKRKQYKQQ